MKNSHSKRLWNWLPLFAVALAGCQPAALPEKKIPPVAVRTVAVMQQDITRTSTQPATIHPFYETQIRAKVSGYVNKLNVDIGDMVSKGDVLAMLDIPEMDKQILVAEAELAYAQAQESQAQAGQTLAEAAAESAKAKLKQAEAEVAGAQASLDAAEAEFGRTSDLVNRQSIQRRVLDEVRKQRDSQRAAVASAKSAIESAKAEVVVAEAKTTAAKANMAAAGAQTQIAKEKIAELRVMSDYAKLRAPFDGVVSDRMVDVGDLVSADNAPESLMTISQIDKLRIRISVPEIDATHVSRGDVVTLSFPSYPAEEQLKTTVTRFAGSLDPSTRTMMVEADWDNAERKLLPGMFGNATINLSTNVAANVLPARAIRFDESGKAYVYLVDEDKAKKVDITIGADDGSTIEILSGVTSGQQVIDAHLQRFTTGQTINRLN